MQTFLLTLYVLVLLVMEHPEETGALLGIDSGTLIQLSKPTFY